MQQITSPSDPNLDKLCERLRELASDSDERWPAEQLRLCGQHGVFRWFAAEPWGGYAWSHRQIIEGYLKLGAADLTTTFIITQRSGACRRIESSDNHTLKEQLLPDLVAGRTFATVGISHLTTSRRHMRQPVLRATSTGSGFRVDGYSPWVTGARSADFVVMGATLDDSRQILFAIPTDTVGVDAGDAHRLVALSGSQTGPVECDRVAVSAEQVLAGPIENVMAQGVGAGTGGLQTSTLALGLAAEAINFIGRQADNRTELTATHQALASQHDYFRQELLKSADGVSECSPEQLRTDANSLVLRATQSALVAAKGAGYVAGHPVGRWCREALFFLVWSCPHGVLAANLCELAGIQD